MADQTHVLFVEDDDVIREATTLALERDGFVVTAMPDGLSGLEAFRSDRPDIALLDVMVPGLDGVSLCRRIRDESMVPVIMLSGREQANIIVEAVHLGAADYVVKPHDGDGLGDLALDSAVAAIGCVLLARSLRHLIVPTRGRTRRGAW